MRKKKTAAKRHSAPTGVSDKQVDDTVSRLQVIGSTLPQRRSNSVDCQSVDEFAEANQGQWIKVKKYASRTTANSVRQYVKNRYDNMDASCRDAVLYVRAT